MTLSERQSAERFASLRSAEASLAVWPLLRRQVVVAVGLLLAVPSAWAQKPPTPQPSQPPQWCGWTAKGLGRERLPLLPRRPRQTQTEGLKVPVVYETSPYFSGTGPMNTNYYWPVQQELGAAPPERPEAS